MNGLRNLSVTDAWWLIAALAVAAIGKVWLDAFRKKNPDEFQALEKAAQDRARAMYPQHSPVSAHTRKLSEESSQSLQSGPGAPASQPDWRLDVVFGLCFGGLLLGVLVNGFESGPVENREAGVCKALLVVLAGALIFFSYFFSDRSYLLMWLKPFVQRGQIGKWNPIIVGSTLMLAGVLYLISVLGFFSTGLAWVMLIAIPVAVVVASLWLTLSSKGREAP